MSFDELDWFASMKKTIKEVVTSAQERSGGPEHAEGVQHHRL